MHKTALVTGGNRGIGLEIVRQLAERGFIVYLACRNEVVGRQASAGISGEVHVIQMDVSKPISIIEAAWRLAAECKGLDVLVNNAAVLLGEHSSIKDMDMDLLERTLQTNTLGALRVAQEFLPMLEKSETPRIINVSSGAGQLSDGLGTWAPAYCISKTALNAVTRQLASALPRFAVNSVTPGWVRTKMGGEDAPLTIVEGADSIVWLATEAPQSLTGKFLREREEIEW